jgi:hypothetical protein
MAQKTPGASSSTTTNNVNMNGSAPLNNAAPNPSNKAIGFGELLNTMASASGLSEEGKHYFQAIDAKLTDFGSAIKSFPVSTPRIEGRVYIDTISKFGITFMASETYSAMDGTPAAGQTVDFANMAKSVRKDLELIQSIVVTPRDYVKADNMAAFIRNSIEGRKCNSQLTISSLAGESYSVITRKEVVDDWIAKNSPHAIPARNDNGILVCIDKKTGNVGRFGQPEVQQEPFMAIAGYTRILSPEDSGTGKYVPIFIITDVVCKLPNGNLLPFIDAVCTDAAIIQSLWSRPYANFAVKDQPNLGNLFTDQKTGQPWNITSVEEFHRFVRESLASPFLAIDITEGRARPVGIDYLLGQTTRNVFLQNMQAFLNGAMLPVGVNGDIIAWSCQNYNGTYSENGVIKDTRCVDYLRLAPKMPNAMAKIRPLLRQPDTPDGRLNQIRDIFSEGVENLYITTTVVIDAAFTIGVANAMVGIKMNYDTPHSGINSIAPLLNSRANDFSAFSTMNRVAVNGQNPYGQPTCIYSI